MSKRPVCVHCGATYGQRAVTNETVKWRDGEAPPPYRGNGIVLKDVNPAQSYRTTSRETVRALTALSVNPKVRAHQEADLAKVPEESFHIASRTIWDGETWYGGNKPFCTLRCALDFARKAFLAGYRP